MVTFMKNNTIILNYVIYFLVLNVQEQKIWLCMGKCIYFCDC